MNDSPGGRRAAVLGHPIGHSLSPVLHRAAYEALGLDWSYEAVDLTEDQVLPFLAGLDDRWAGLSVTAPLKQAVQPALTDMSALARKVGAVNTIVCEGAGSGRRLMGHNTDVVGIVEALAEDPHAALAVDLGIVGAGGTAAAALAAAERLGMQHVDVTARREQAVGQLFEQLAVPEANVVPWADVAAVLARDIVIMTLPGDAAAPLAEWIPQEPGLLLDVTYHPWPTTLAAEWSRRGGAVVAGHRMLLWQAVAQVHLMTGQRPPAEAMAAALATALGH